MAKITIQSRLAAAPQLAAMLQVHGASLAAGMDRKLARFGVPGEETPGLVGVLDRLRRGVLEARRELARRDEEARDHRLASRRARQRRDRSAATLRDSLVTLRILVWKMGGELAGVEKILWLTEDTGRDPVVLVTQARNAVAGLKKAEGSLLNGAGWLPGSQLNLPSWFEILDKEVSELEEALTEVAFAKARETGALITRRRAAEAFDELFAPASRWVAALAALAGAPAGAFRVSAVARRSRQRRSSALPASPTPHPPVLASANDA